MVPLHLVLTSLFSFSLWTISSAKLITSLPGQPANVSFKQYSGYIVTDVQHGRALFYYFMEADSDNPLSHPLTVWFNGGPGCSSIGLGAFMENGPFQPGNDGNLIRNKYSWNSASNMLYVESPVGVGFSYSNTSSDYHNWTDTATAWNNLQFILNWFKIYPVYRDSDLYLTGESYAGHYIPQLVMLLLEYNRQPNNKPVKFRAIAVLILIFIFMINCIIMISCTRLFNVQNFSLPTILHLGNPLLDIDISIDAGEFLWSHGVISDELLAIKKSVCNDSRYLLEKIHNNISKECLDMYAIMIQEIGDDTYANDLLLPKCLSSTTQSVFMGDIAYAKLHKKIEIGDPCLGGRIIAYLNNPRVQEALHVKSTPSSVAWNLCSRDVDYQIDNLATNIIPLLSEILREYIPILLFSGDQDATIPLTQTRKIANMIAKDLELTAFGRYGPWYDGLQVGGWSQSFGRVKESKNTTYLTFATVKGAAHEVPFTSPSQALTLFKAFLKGLPPPKTSNI